MLYNVQLRAVLVQAMALAIFVGLIVGGAMTAWMRMQAQGMAYGFGILTRPTGWDVSSVFLGQTPNDPYWWVLFVALVNTLFVAIVSIVLASIVGFFVGIMRHAGNPLLSLVLATYVEVFRNVPLILQLVFWYAVFSSLPSGRQTMELMPDVFLSNQGLFIPSFSMAGSGLLATIALAIGLGTVIWVLVKIGTETRRPWALPALVWKPAAILIAIVVVGFALAALLVFNAPVKQRFSFDGGLAVPLELFTIIFSIVIFSSAYIAEVVRGGIQAVPKGQWEASHAVGLKRWQTYAYVTLPIALRAILPSLGNQYVFIVKSTALGIAVGFSDIFSVSVVSITQSGQTIEFLIILMVIYLVLNYSLSTLINVLNSKLSLARRH